MDISLVVLKLVIMTALLNPNSILPIQLSIDNVSPDEVPFKIDIHFEVLNSTGNIVLSQDYEKMITQYKESYSGVLKLHPTIPPGNYKLVAIVSINGQPYMKFEQEFEVVDGLDVQYKAGKSSDSKNLNVDFVVQNTAGQDMSLVLYVKVYDENGALVVSGKEIVSVASMGSIEKVVSVPLVDLPSGDYKAVVGYSVVGDAEYSNTIGEIQFGLENNLQSGVYVAQHFYYAVIGGIILGLLLWAVKK